MVAGSVLGNPAVTCYLFFFRLAACCYLAFIGILFNMVEGLPIGSTVIVLAAFSLGMLTPIVCC